MKKFLALLLLVSLGIVADSSARSCGRPCKKSCGAVITKECEIPKCYVTKTYEEEVPAECEKVCWCPPGSTQNGVR